MKPWIGWLCAPHLVIAGLVVLAPLPLRAGTLAGTFPSLSAAEAATENSPPSSLAQYERFLVDLYNGLVRLGRIPGDPVPDANAFWNKVDPDKFEVAVTAVFGGKEGGIVTQNGIFPSKTPFTTSLDAANRLTLILNGVVYVVQPRRGRIDCEVSEINGDTPLKYVAMADNVRCIFADKVRAAYLAAGGSGGEVSWDFVESSNAEWALRDYLGGLVDEGLLTKFSVDLEEGTVTFEFPGQEGDPVPVPLLLSLVNPFPAAASEVSDAATSTQSLVETHFMALSEWGGATYPRADLDLGLQAIRTTQVPQRRSVFFEAIGLGPLLPGFVFPQVTPCSYGNGVVTPCNKDFVVLWGADDRTAFHPGVDGFNELQNTLTGFGYQKTQINAQCHFQAGDERQFRMMRAAQTLILNVHGANGGFTNWQCYPDIKGWDDDGPNRECCEAMKRTAIELGIPGASNIDCSVPGPNRPSRTPGNELQIGTTGLPGPTFENRCPCSTSGPSNRCQVIGTNNALTSMGLKAAVFTGQCFGGQCPTDAPALAGAVMDFMGQTVQTNYPDPEICDDRRVSLDLQGLAMYCRDTTAVPPGREPWRGAASSRCSGAHDGLMPGAPSALRTVQGSLATRGSWAGSGLIAHCETRYTADGYEQFNAANLGGNQNTLVEFAPAVSLATFLPEFGVFAASFTSTVRSGCRIDVELSGGTRKTLSTHALTTSVSCDASGAIVALSGDPAWLSQGEWERPAAELQAIYGADQSSWPWYIKIRISGAVAPNGIKLVGNQSANKKWIWASPADPNSIPPYLYSSGMFPAGGSTYEVWIPVAPSFACCMPYIEWSYPPGGGAPTPRQNGCTCAGAGKDFCFAGTCVVCDSAGCFPSSSPGMNPAECPGSYQRFNGEWKLWHDCCPVSWDTNVCEQAIHEITPPTAGCVLGEIVRVGRTWNQHIARPWDMNSPERCPPIEAFQACLGLD